MAPKKKGKKGKGKKKKSSNPEDEEKKQENEELKVDLPKFGWVKITVSNIYLKLFVTSLLTLCWFQILLAVKFGKFADSGNQSVRCIHADLAKGLHGQKEDC